MNSTYGKPKGVTKEKVTGVFFAGVALFHAAASVTHGAGFVTTDLEGTWEIRMQTPNVFIPDSPAATPTIFHPMKGPMTTQSMRGF